MSSAAIAKTNGESIKPTMEIVKDTPVTKTENPILSLEKKIQKVNELNMIIDKWKRLNEARTNLTGFKLGADGLSSTVTIRDVSGQEFKTSHGIVVETVLASVKEVLDKKISEVENQISFEI